MKGLSKAEAADERLNSTPSRRGTSSYPGGSVPESIIFATAKQPRNHSDKTHLWFAIYEERSQVEGKIASTELVFSCPSPKLHPGQNCVCYYPLRVQDA